MQSIVVLTQVEHNRAMRADHWKPPRLAWVFQSPSGGAAAAAREGLEEQLNLGFAFTSPLEVAVVKDTKPLRPRRSADDDGEGVKGAPPGHAAVEKGAPPGMAVAAAAPAKAKAMAVAADASAPTAKAKSKGAGKGRGRGLKRPAASTPPPAEDTGAPEAEGVEPAPAAIGKHRRISVPDGVKLGCSKCKWAEIGCTTCRPKAGLVESSKGVWSFNQDQT